MSFVNNLEHEKTDLEVDELPEMKTIRNNRKVDPDLYEAFNQLHEVAIKINNLRNDPGGYNLIQYASKIRSLSDELDVKQSRVESLSQLSFDEIFAGSQ